jgi:hypothetical protein
MRLYKLTASDGYTRNNTYWTIGTRHKATGVPKLCSHSVIHAYTSPLLATMMNPAHAGFYSPQCFIVEGEIVISDGTKVGSQDLTVVDTFKLPKVNTIQRVVFGILAAKEVYRDSKWNLWAGGWLSGIDRTASSAYAAAYAAYAAYAAAAYAADAAAYAADAAANAADAAANAADAAANAADAAANAADAAANAADAAVVNIDFEFIAQRAMEVV